MDGGRAATITAGVSTRAVFTAAGNNQDHYEERYDEGDDHKHLHPAPCCVGLGVGVAGRLSHVGRFPWSATGDGGPARPEPVDGLCYLPPFRPWPSRYGDGADGETPHERNFSVPI